MSLTAKLFPRRFVQSSLHDTLSGVFAIEPSPLQLAVEEAAARIAAMSASEIRSLAQTDRSDAPAHMTVVDGVAHIPIEGVLIRGDASCARWMGMRATGFAEIQYALDVALASADVKSIVLDIDSPGGSASGLQALADDIFEARAKKQITAHVTGQMASAAYWLGCNASRITAEPTAVIGSIGAYSVVADTSKLAESAGVKVHVLRSGEHKGAGTPGAPISDKQLAAMQELVDDLAAVFTDTVSRARGFEAAKAKELSSGKAWIASKALDVGLIDGIENARAAHTRALGGAPGARAESDSGVAATSTAPTSAEEEMSEKKETAPAPVAAAPQVDAKDAELAKLKAQLEIAETALKAQKQTQLDAIIEQHVSAGRVTPAMRPDIVRAAAAYADAPAELDAFLAKLPVQTKAKATGVTEARNEDKLADQVNEALAKHLSISMEEAAARASVFEVGADGKLYDAAGKVVGAVEKGAKQ